MRILVVDDLREFSFEAVYARNLAQAANQLNLTNQWDEVWLDNDLGEVNGVKEEVYSLVVIIEESAYNGVLLPVGRFILHSSHVGQRNKMFWALNKYYPTEVKLPNLFLRHRSAAELEAMLEPCFKEID